MRARHEALAPEPLFAGLEYTDDAAELAEWLPLMMAGRDPAQVVAATRSEAGTDVNFGALTRHAVRRRRRARRRRPLQPAGARPDPRDRRPLAGRACRTPSPASGARCAPGSCSSAPAAARCRCCSGAGIPEIQGFGGFPVSGKFLRTFSPELVSRHQAKVYGQAAVGAPPMSVPHLDLRLIDGDRSLLFGPYAGLLAEVPQGRARSSTCPPASGRTTSARCSASPRTNIPLTNYLIRELLKSPAGPPPDAHPLRAHAPRSTTGR